MNLAPPQLAPMALAQADAPGADPVSPPAQAIYLALGVSLLLFLLLFVLIGINVVRRIQRRRSALDAPSGPRPHGTPDSAWATAGKRAKPLPNDPLDLADLDDDFDDDDLEDTAL